MSGFFDDLAEKRVVVTGAAGGIGRAVAIGFAEAGARVVAADVKFDDLQDVVRDLPGEGHTAIRVDLFDIPSIGGFVSEAVGALGRIDVLAHAAGIALRRQIADVTEADWDLQHTVNLKASFFLNREIASHMQGDGAGGRIINFSSQGFWTGGFGGSVVYNSSKGGIVTMSRGLARTYGPDQILVNTVAPGLVDTPMLRTGLPDEVLADLIRQVPLGRMAEPSDIVGAVLFLASKHASYITGANINLSGGFLMY